MYRELTVGDAPSSVVQFVREVVELHLRDVHSMLRLPLPELGIDAACNFTCASALLGIISGASVVLYDPTRIGDRGLLFKACVGEYFPWDQEPSDGLCDPNVGGIVLYDLFRNPFVHAMGYDRDAEQRSVARCNRGPATESDLEFLETSESRPSIIATKPTLCLDKASVSPFALGPAGYGYSVRLTVEPLYWGVRKMLTRLTADAERMAIADERLRGGA